MSNNVDHVSNEHSWIPCIILQRDHVMLNKNNIEDFSYVVDETNHGEVRVYTKNRVYKIHTRMAYELEMVLKVLEYADGKEIVPIRLLVTFEGNFLLCEPLTYDNSIEPLELMEELINRSKFLEYGIFKEVDYKDGSIDDVTRELSITLCFPDSRHFDLKNVTNKTVNGVLVAIFWEAFKYGIHVHVKCNGVDMCADIGSSENSELFSDAYYKKYSNFWHVLQLRHVLPYIQHARCEVDSVKYFRELV